MTNCVIDFESYYDREISVTQLGTPNYVAASDAYVVGVCVDGERRCGTLTEMAPLMENLSRDRDVRPVAANSNFDQAWAEKYGWKFQNAWHCVLDQAVANQHPRNLADLSGVVLGETVDKTVRDDMKGKRYADLSATKQQEVIEYCLKDCITTMEVLEKMPAMSSFEEKVAAHTRAMNSRGVCINRELITQDKSKIEAMRADALEKIPWYKDAKPLSPKALAVYCEHKNIPVPKSLAKTNEETTELMTENPELAQIIGQMRRYRKANTMLEKISALERRLTVEGVLPLDLLYCGAPHTRRWSSVGFNIQNLDKEPLDVGNGQTVWTRNWIIPRPGKIFYILDLAQIEPRCLNWLAGNDQMMEALRNGFSIYEAFAIMAEGWKGKPGTIKEEFGKKRYTLLKNRVLGLGYGMGHNRFVSYVNQNGGEIALPEAQKIVREFRLHNHKIVKFWKKLDCLIARAALNGDRKLSLEMPSGERLQHFNIRYRDERYESYTIKGDFSRRSHQPSLWGGVLTENVTQRMARDVLANAILNLEAAGLPVVFSVHDEVVIEVDDNEATKDEAKRTAHKIMTTPPEWASDLPLGAEGSFATAYTK